MKKVILALMVLVLAGCDAETKNITNKFIIPEELHDCKIYGLQADGGGVIYAMVCPNSTVSTTYPMGKTQGHTVTYTQ